MFHGLRFETMWIQCKSLWLSWRTFSESGVTLQLQLMNMSGCDRVKAAVLMGANSNHCHTAICLLHFPTPSAQKLQHQSWRLWENCIKCIKYKSILSYYIFFLKKLCYIQGIIYELKPSKFNQFFFDIKRIFVPNLKKFTQRLAAILPSQLSKVGWPDIMWIRSTKSELILGL